jgi:hypothetical protein
MLCLGVRARRYDFTNYYYDFRGMLEDADTKMFKSMNISVGITSCLLSNLVTANFKAVVIIFLPRCQRDINKKSFLPRCLYKCL